jgi:hypothetical protein
MEDIAIDIKTNLQGQTQKMGQVRDKLHGIQDQTVISTRVMADIKKQRRFNRLILYGVIALITLSLILIAYFKIIA